MTIARVVFSQTVELVRGLRKETNVEPELLVIPNEVHDFILHRSWRRVFEATHEFHRPLPAAARLLRRKAMPISRREMLMQTGLLAGATVMGGFAVADSTGTPASGADANLFTRLDEFARQYMEEMKAPGMTLALADRKGLRRVVHYGFGAVEHRVPVRDDELFEIGSISKSFVAICLLQLRDEGKLDLNKPIVEYLPWFRIDSAFAPITTHHLLTHGAGLPGNCPLLPSDPSLRHQGRLCAWRELPLLQHGLRGVGPPRIDARWSRAARGHSYAHSRAARHDAVGNR